MNEHIRFQVKLAGAKPPAGSGIETGPNTSFGQRAIGTGDQDGLADIGSVVPIEKVSGK